MQSGFLEKRFALFVFNYTINCFLNHKDEVCGVDPTVFRRFYHEEIEEFDEDVAEPQYVDKRCDVSRFKQPKLF